MFHKVANYQIAEAYMIVVCGTMVTLAIHGLVMKWRHLLGNYNIMIGCYYVPK